MKRRTLVAAAIGALVLPLVAVTPGLAQPVGGVSWKHHEEAGGYWRTPQDETESSGGGGGSDEPISVWYEYGMPWQCDENRPDFLGSEVLCLGSEHGGVDVAPGTMDPYCSTTPADPDYTPDEYIPQVGDNDRPMVAVARWIRDVEDPDNPGPWVLDPDHDPAVPPGMLVCSEVGDDDWISDEDIWEINYEVFQELGDPEIAISPPNARTIVNLPTVFFTDYPEDPGLPDGDAELVSLDPVTIEIPINVVRPGQNLTGTLTSTADFGWEFEPGATGRGRGLPYDPSVDPVRNSDHYVSHQFTTAESYVVELTAVWTGEVDVTGLAETQPIEPIEFSSTADVDVVELSSVLTGN